MILLNKSLQPGNKDNVNQSLILSQSPIWILDRQHLHKMKNR